LPPIKIATDADFQEFIAKAKGTEGWTVQYDSPTCKVWDKASDSSINVVKMEAILEKVPALLLYDVLHDADYRSVWDDRMIEGFNIEQLDDNNDVGYYAAAAPMPVSNRDWVNQRSWQLYGAPDKPDSCVIFNHSVLHPKQPEKKGFVRANSILTGYLVENRAGGGSVLTYLTQNDPKGWIPSWLTNQATKKFAPQIVEKLVKASLAYEEWKGKQTGSKSKRPWRGL